MFNSFQTFILVLTQTGKKNEGRGRKLLNRAAPFTRAVCKFENFFLFFFSITQILFIFFKNIRALKANKCKGN